MPIEPVKIPQNVYIEDRIIGPVTLRQILLLMLGGGISYVIWTILQRAGFTDIITTILSWTPLAITAAFGFIRINEIDLLRFCFLMCEKTQKPQVRYWQQRTGIVLHAEKLVLQVELKEKQAPQTMGNIDELSNTIDSGPLLPQANTDDESPTSVLQAVRAAQSVDSVTPPTRIEMKAPPTVPPTAHHG